MSQQNHAPTLEIIPNADQSIDFDAECQLLLLQVAINKNPRLHRDAYMLEVLNRNPALATLTLEDKISRVGIESTPDDLVKCEAIWRNFENGELWRYLVFDRATEEAIETSESAQHVNRELATARHAKNTEKIHFLQERQRTVRFTTFFSRILNFQRDQ